MSQGAAGDVFFERDVVEHEAWREAPGRFAPPPPADFETFARRAFTLL
jgi:hypothetical protein